MTISELRKDNVGFVLYDEKQKVIAHLHYSEKNLIAYIEFANLRINFGHIIKSVLSNPISREKFRQLCWKHVLDSVNAVKGETKYAAVFTRIDVGSGHNTLRNRMNQIVAFVFDRWYDPSIRREMEQEQDADYINTRLYRRIDRQNYYPRD